MKASLSALVERSRTSLFFVPALFVVGAVLLGSATIWLDNHLDISTQDLPLGIASTVESSRSVLSTIAAATITFAGIAFSVALLTIQMASSQYSPRVLHGLFRDPFNRRVMGIVVGTFTYCLIVLRAVRSPLADGGSPVIPTIGVGIAVVLGIGSILALIAFINHSAHRMDISEILATVTNQTLEEVEASWPLRDEDEVAHDRSERERAEGLLEAAREMSTTITFAENGWIQDVDEGALVALPESIGVVRFESAVGCYAIAGTPLCTVWPAPHDAEDLRRRARQAVSLGATRTLTRDPTYGIRQLVDVALKGLSPGVNDPTTAQDAIVHLGAVLREIQRRPEPPKIWTDDRRTVLLRNGPGHPEVLSLAFSEIRQVAAPHPIVCIYVLETMTQLLRALHGPRRPEVVPLIRHEARLVLEACMEEEPAAADAAKVRATYEGLCDASADVVTTDRRPSPATAIDR